MSDAQGRKRGDPAVACALPEPERATAGQLARALPDAPRWVETRSALLSGRGEVFGLDEVGELRFIVRDPEERVAFVVGRPAEDAIREAASRDRERYVVVAQLGDVTHVAAALPGWKASRATIHLLGDAPRLPRVPAGAARLLEVSELASLVGLPPHLRSELGVAVRRSPIAAGMEDGHPVSFCYAAARTEGLWDISIDTIEENRRQGHAGRCVSLMAEQMGKEDLRPVWGAEEWNRASLRLAEKLGFVPVEELVVFRPAGVS